MMTLKEKIQEGICLFDGAFGTYYGELFDTEELPEKANEEYPERVLQIHKEYIEAGADIIRTNTFAANTVSLSSDWKTVEKNLRQGYALAKQAAEGKQVYVAADIGQIPYLENEKETRSDQYKKICQVFLEEGAEVFVFETLSDLEDLKEALEMIGDRAYVIVQFSLNQFGYSHSGFSGKKLIEQAEKIEPIDALGLNCGIGPGHMSKILKEISVTGKKHLTILPNAGYPKKLYNRLVFDKGNLDYFTDKICEMAELGADLVGGCCGTTPEHIRRMKEQLKSRKKGEKKSLHMLSPSAVKKKNNAFYEGKSSKKLIAVELAPPLGIDDEKIMDAAHLLEKSQVDVLTFPDSPSGRTRADSIMMANRVFAETGIPVMPHICCRDKNAIAMRSQLLGAHINQVTNFLVITGDPIPSLVRSSVKSVFNFDSVGLMRLIREMNEDQFEASPLCYGGCINQGRRNLELEIGRVKKKMEAGASFFLTQPVSTKTSADRVRKIKEETGARILCGIMPFISLRNAMFMKNEMTGIEVTKEVLERYHADMTKEEGEEAGVSLAKEMIEYTKDFADGYYFSFPFNRVYLLEKIMSDYHWSEQE